MEQVIKRDGRKVRFDKNRVYTAVMKAMKHVDHVDELTALSIAKYIENINGTKTVEEIQDIVEQRLMATDFKDVAKAYIIYRAGKNKVREENKQFNDVISEKLTARNVQNQNANVDEASFGGRKGEAASELMRRYALKYCMSEMARKNHENNMIYIHDLDSYAVGEHNCLTLPFDKLLANGFNTRQTDVRPANSINTAFQLVAVLFQLQSLMQFGGVSASHIDWTMVPYIRKSFVKHFNDGLEFIENIKPYSKDVCKKLSKESIEHQCFKQYTKAYDYAMKKTKQELDQAVEAMYHNLK